MSDAALMSAVFIGIVAGFYVLFMRPVQKENEQHRQQIRDLRPGDDVLTTSGFIATVKDIQIPPKGRTRIKLELAEGVVFIAVTSAIAERLVDTADSRNNEKGASG